jgi:hypothetical protein
MTKLLRLTYMILAVTSVISSMSARPLGQPAEEPKPCTCGIHLGRFCGSETDSGLLTGNCEGMAIYRCSFINAPARVVSFCSACRQSEQPGRDYGLSP